MNVRFRFRLAVLGAASPWLRRVLLAVPFIGLAGVGWAAPHDPQIRPVQGTVTPRPMIAALGYDRGERCQAPMALVHLSRALPRTAARLAMGAPLMIVAIGSSSTQGVGASAPSFSYPRRLEARLRALVSRTRKDGAGAPVRVVNAGVGGETEDAMLARFDRDVFAHHPDLVIWQVGSNTVLHDGDVAAYRHNLDDGLRRLQAAGSDVILMDAQFAPQLLAQPALTGVETGAERQAAVFHVPVFHRFAIMGAWISQGSFTFTDVLAPDGLHMNDTGYDCLARLLALAIADAAGIPVHHARRPLETAAAPGANATP